MKQIKGALFDLDGVLLDSEDIYTQFWNAVEEQFPTGIPNFAHVIKGSTSLKSCTITTPTTRFANR